MDIDCLKSRVYKSRVDEILVSNWSVGKNSQLWLVEVITWCTCQEPEFVLIFEIQAGYKWYMIWICVHDINILLSPFNLSYPVKMSLHCTETVSSFIRDSQRGYVGGVVNLLTFRHCPFKVRYFKHYENLDTLLETENTYLHIKKELLEG